MYAALARGGPYRNTPADSQVPYPRTAFAFLDLQDLQFVYVEGLSTGEEAARRGIASAYRQIEERVAA